MIRSEYQSRFNPDTVVPHSRVKKLLITIRQFSGDSDKQRDESSVVTDPGILEMGQRMMQQLAEAKDDLITELVTLFYSLSNEERDTLPTDEREEMYEQIKSARPDLIRFLSL